jgi:hypothetical protein
VLICLLANPGNHVIAFFCVCVSINATASPRGRSVRGRRPSASGVPPRSSHGGRGRTRLGRAS